MREARCGFIIHFIPPGKMTGMPQQPAMSSLRVLYIEDNELVREITCDLLAGDKQEVVAVATAEEALSAFKAGRFDIVVTDVSLPAMSGLDLVRHLKEIAPLVPIILASGYRLDPDFFKLGPNIRAITKPFSAPDLQALIQDLCGTSA
jgi:two-component system, cell cycle response regulator CpdR